MSGSHDFVAEGQGQARGTPMDGETVQTLSESYAGHRLTMACPHCGQRARVRSSRALSVLVRSCNLQCSNVECGHTFVAQLHVTHTIAPSLRPNPEVSLPIAARRLKPANDRCAGAPPLAPPAPPLTA